jgi:hypothetical protein
VNTVDDRANDDVSRTLDQEMRIIREAIAMVASGGSRRVVLGSLRFSEVLLEQARSIALGQGVRIVPLWTIDDSGPGIAVELIESA